MKDTLEFPAYIPVDLHIIPVALESSGGDVQIGVQPLAEMGVEASRE